MKLLKIGFLALALFVTGTTTSVQAQKSYGAETKESQAAMTPQMALQRLKDGNANFQKNLNKKRNLQEEVKAGCGGQEPFATILHCIDSRVSAELIFDQGVGDIFSIRIAGNFVNQDILGSMEFASIVSTTRLIVVMGHTACGAVKGACDDAKLGNLTAMLTKLKPAVAAVPEPSDPSERTSKNAKFVDDVARKNVELTIQRIIDESDEIKSRMADVDVPIQIVGAMYDVCDGSVTFFD